MPCSPPPQLEEAWLDDEHSEFLEQLKMEMLEEQQREEMELAALQEAPEYEQVRKRRNTCSAPPRRRVKDSAGLLKRRLKAAVWRRVCQTSHNESDEKLMRLLPGIIPVNIDQISAMELD